MAFPYPYVVTIDGVDVDQSVYPIERLTIQEAMNASNRLDFDIATDDGSQPGLDLEVLVTEDGVRIFGGFIAEVKAVGIDWRDAVASTVSCTDFNTLAQFRFLNTTITTGTLKAALTAIVAILNSGAHGGLGITLHPSQADGVTLGEIVLVDTRADAALNDLSTATGWVWEIDYYKQLRMVDPTAVPGPFDIVSGDGNTIGDITVEQTRNDIYANRVTIRSPQISRIGQIEMFTGDGATNLFVLSGTPIRTYGYVTYAGAFNTLSEPGGGGQWELDGRNLSRVAGAPANLASIIITVDDVYTAEAMAEDTGEQDDHGLREIILDGPEGASVATLQTLADGELARRIQTFLTVTYTTDQLGVRPGQTQGITEAYRGLSGYYLVTSVRAVDDHCGVLLRSVTAISATRFQGSPLDIFSLWSKNGGVGGSGASIIATGVGSSGTVTSVALSLPSIFSVSGSPVTTIGTLTATLQTQAANRIFAGPTSGGSSTPTFRALVAADMPADLPTGTTIGSAYIYRAGGTDVPVTDGGTGVSTLAANGVLYGNGTGVVQVTGAGGVNSVLMANGGAPSFSSAPTVGSLTATTSVSVPTIITGSGNLTLSPAGDLILNPGGADVLPSTSYLINLGGPSLKILSLWAAELNIDTIVARDVVSTIGGRIFVAPTSALAADITSGATAISLKHNEAAVGDFLRFEARGQVEYMKVTAGPTGSGPYGYTVTRNEDGSGADAWLAGDAAVNTGTTGDGYLDLFSTIGSAGPLMAGVVRTGTAYSNLAVRWVIGNLNSYYGYGAQTYGAAFGDPSGTNVTVDATNGFRIRSSTTDLFKADTSGNLSILGDLSIGSSGILRSGATSFASGTGFVFDYNSGTPRFRVGTASGNRIAWDGSALVIGSNKVTINSAAGISILGSSSLLTESAYGFTFPNAGSVTGIYARQTGAGPFSFDTYWLNSSTAGHASVITIEATNTNTTPRTQTASIVLNANGTTPIGYVTVTGTDGISMVTGAGPYTSVFTAAGYLSLPYVASDNAILRLGDNTNGWALTENVDASLRIATAQSGVSTLAPRVWFMADGKVGIGATVPSGTGTGQLKISGAGSNSTSFIRGGSGSLAGGVLELEDTSNAATNGGQIVFSTAAFGPFAGIKGSLQNGTGPAGDLIIQTSTTSGNLRPVATFDQNGAVRFDVYGTGTLQTDASGNITAASDERLKADLRPFLAGLEVLRGVRPILYRWSEASGLDRSRDYAGFSAQNVAAVLPEAVGVDGRGYLTLSDRVVLAAVVNALHAVDARLAALEAV